MDLNTYEQRVHFIALGMNYYRNLHSALKAELGGLIFEENLAQMFLSKK